MSADSRPSREAQKAGQRKAKHHCGAEFTGRQEHCAACCRTFAGTYVGDMHREGDWDKGTRRCITDTELRAKGALLRADGTWVSGTGTARGGHLRPAAGLS